MDEDESAATVDEGGAAVVARPEVLGGALGEGNAAMA